MSHDRTPAHIILQKYGVNHTHIIHIYSLYSTSPLHGCFDYFWLKMIKEAAAAALGCHSVCLLVFGVFGEWYQIQLVISHVGFLIVDPKASTFHIKAARCR